MYGLSLICISILNFDVIVIFYTIQIKALQTIKIEFEDVGS